MLKQLPYIISGFIVGIILFQSSLIAPAINNLTSQKKPLFFLDTFGQNFLLLLAACLLLHFCYLTLILKLDQF